MPGQATDPTSSAGARIAALIESSGATAEDVAAGMLLPPEVGLAEVLDGSYEPSLSEIVAAADVLRVPAAVLLGDLPVEGHLGVSLRLGRISGAEALAGPLAYANRMLDHRSLLDSWLGAAEAPLRDLLSRVMLSRHRFGKRAGAESADRIRAVLGVGDEEPVGDLTELLEQFGIPVAFLPLPEGVHGLNVRDLRSGGPDRVVLVSSADVWAKQRYTLAHEFCHALYDDEDQLIVDRAEEPVAEPEWRAEAFARHMLLPRRAVLAAVRNAGSRPNRWRSVTARLMSQYGISRDATVIALAEDGGVPDEELDQVRYARVDDLMAEAGLLDAWRTFNEGQHDETGSQSLVARAAQAYGNGWIRPELVADLMRVEVAQAEQALADAGWRPSVGA